MTSTALQKHKAGLYVHDAEGRGLVMCNAAPSPATWPIGGARGEAEPIYEPSVRIPLKNKNVHPFVSHAVIDCPTRHIYNLTKSIIRPNTIQLWEDNS